MPYKAVFFDMGNTLVSYYNKEEFAPVLEKCLLNALAYLRREGLVFEPAVILESAWKTAWQPFSACCTLTTR